MSDVVVPVDGAPVEGSDVEGPVPAVDEALARELVERARSEAWGLSGRAGF